LERWPPEERQQIRTEVGDAFFNLVFRNEAGLRDRTAACQAVQGFLLRNPQHVGILSLQDAGSPRGLESVTVHRGRVTNGPRFSHFSAGRWHPPQVGVLEAKLAPERYRSDIPLELFAYSIHDEPDLAVGSLEQLQEAIVRLLPASSFRRAHIFDFGLHSHLYSYPD
jgi:hypothetical protein